MSKDAPSVRPESPRKTDHPEQLVRHVRESEEIFRVLVNSVTDYAIFVLDRSGHIMTWNEGAQRLKGYSADEIVGRHFSTFYTEEARAIGHPDRELELAIEAGRYEEEGWRVRKDGTMFWANVVITPLYDKKNELIAFGKVTRDLTERKIAEQQREENSRLLTETNEELQRLAYVVSHELQAPMATILRYGNLLSVRYKDRLGDDANDFIQKITSASKLVAKMIDDLWIYARTSAPQSDVELVYLKNVLTEVSEELKHDLEGAEIIYGELPSVPGNRRQLFFLFKELISNAVKYRRAEPPRIEISARSDAEGHLISIKDNGIGIDKVYSEEVFKLFHRLEGSPESSSTGMGLAICQKIASQHRGRIWFESQLGYSTTFFVWLPESIKKR